MTVKRQLRCAVYTRKSTEEGLEQAFNSLDAQREACEAYVASQKAEGWVLLDEKFDDGGYSGGTLERPALQRLLQYIESGRADVVVVYKIDRLSRSLMDFAKLVEVFDRKDVTFVSVTQSFNTTTSMGRLTLNVLLSFAQFEREVIGERIRDKFAASKKRGMWMGGNPPLGYDISSRKLLVNPAEAKTVNLIFQRYIDLGCVRTLRSDLEARGVVSKIWTSERGHNHGGQPFDRGALYCLLKNRIYLGETTHKGNIYPGEHSAIVARELFGAAKVRLASGRRQRRSKHNTSGVHPLTGLIFDDRGNSMTPSYSRKSDGREYRYYVCSSILAGKRSHAGAIARVPAQAIEDIVHEAERRLGLVSESGNATAKVSAHPSPEKRAGLQLHSHHSLLRVEIHAHSIAVHFDQNAALARWRSIVNEGDAVTDAELIAGRIAELAPGQTLSVQGNVFVLALPIRAKFRGGRTGILAHDGRAVTSVARVDHALTKALARAHAWSQMLVRGEVISVEELAVRVKQHRGYVSEVIRLAFLSPEVTKAVLEGRQRPSLRLADLLAADIPLTWAKQAEMFL